MTPFRRIKKEQNNTIPRSCSAQCAVSMANNEIKP